MTKNLQQIKSGLAKLLANENITVRHENQAKTASFDVMNRVLVLPNWIVSDELYDMLLVHEVGHALFTDREDWVEYQKLLVKVISPSQKKNPKAMGIAHDYLNVLEDVRIDKLQKRRYPGSKRDYRIGYLQLAKDGFFGDISKPARLKNLNFIDRINIYFKLETSAPGTIDVPFSEDEMVFIKRAEKLETMKDVYVLALDILEFQKVKVDKVRKYRFGKPRLGDPSKDGHLEHEGTIPVKPESKPEEIEPELEEEKESEEETPEKEQETPEEEEADDLDLGSPVDDPNSKFDATGMEKAVADEDEAEDEDEEEIPFDDEVLEELQSDLTELAEDYFRTLIPKKITGRNLYFSTPIVEADPKRYVVPCKDVITIFQDILDEKNVAPSRAFKKFLKGNDRVVSVMIKEFLMRQAADEAKRTKSSRTGLLNMDKLVNYKISDDIFLRQNVVEEGQSHGFVMCIDWSGSMAKNLEASIIQVITLVRFCRKANIPFEVYAFSDNFSKNYLSQKLRPIFDNLKMNNLFNQTRFAGIDNPLHYSYNATMIQFLSSDLNTNQFHQALYFFWRLISKNRPDPFGLGGTPLNSSIFQMEPIIKKFKSKYQTQFTNLIYLTDGGDYTSASIPGQGVKAWSDKDIVNWIDPVTKKVYLYQDPSDGRNNFGQNVVSDATKLAVTILKDRIPGLVAINIYLGSSPYCFKEFQKYYNDNKWGVIFNREGSVVSPKDQIFDGWDQIFLIEPWFMLKYGNQVGMDFSNVDTTDQEKVAAALTQMSLLNKRGNTIVSQMIDRLTRAA